MKNLISLLFFSLNSLVLLSQNTNKNSYIYDNANRIIKESYSPSCEFITYTYDNDGNRLTETKKYFEINATIQNIDCQQPTGSIVLTPVSPGAFSYVWSTGATGNSVSNLAQGNYTVTITDGLTGNVCSREYYVYNFSVSGTAVINHQDVSCFGLSNGWAAVNILNATGGYNYLWSNGQTQDSIFNLAVGTYTVTVTDTVNNCVQNVSVQINQAPLFITGVTSTNTTCESVNDGTATVNVNPGTYVFSWSNGQTLQTATGLPPGNYYVTVTNQAGCIEFDSVTVGNATPLIDSITSTNETCDLSNDGTATVNIIGNIANFTFLWSTGQQTQTINSLNAGNYYITVTNTITGCQQVDSLLITEPDTLDAQFNGHGPNCFGDSTGYVIVTWTIGGTPPYQYSINGSPFSSDTLFTNLPAGNVQIIIKDAGSCMLTFSGGLSQPQPVTLTDSVIQNVTCYGQNNGSVILKATGGTSNYQYSLNGSPYQPSSTFSNLGAGVYTAQVKDIFNCSQTFSFTITQPPAFITGMSSTNPSCASSNNGTATVSVNPGIYTFNWSNGQSLQTANNLAAGLYYVTVTNQSGCMEYDSVLITPPASFILGFTATNVLCFGQSNGTATAQLSGNISSYTTIQWSNGQTGINATGLIAGNYIFSATDSLSCTITDTVTITQPTQLQISTTVLHVSCNSSNDGSVTILSTGGTPIYTYSLDSLSFQSSSVFSNLTAGNYTAYVLDANNCSASIPFIVNQTQAQNGLPILVTGDTLLTSPYSFPSVWYQVGNPIPLDTSYQFICDSTNSYYVVGIDSNGCTAISDTVAACLSVGNTSANVDGTILVYPNPSTGIFSIQFGDNLNGKYLITIYDLAGRKCFQESIFVNRNKKHMIDLTHFAKANYTIHVKGEKLNYVSKLSVE